MSAPPASHSNTALLIVDVQKFLAKDPETCIPNGPRLIAAVEQLIKAARTAMKAGGEGAEGGKVATKYAIPSLMLFIQHEEELSSGALVKGTKEWELVFSPRPDVEREILVGKDKPSTFASNPTLAAKLKASPYNISTLLVCGIQSEMCVENTCNDALNERFEVVLLSGAHGTYDIVEGEEMIKTAEEVKMEVEERLAGKGARVVEWEGVVDDWNGSSQ